MRREFKVLGTKHGDDMTTSLRKAVDGNASTIILSTCTTDTVCTPSILLVIVGVHVLGMESKGISPCFSN